MPYGVESREQEAAREQYLEEMREEAWTEAKRLARFVRRRLPNLYRGADGYGNRVYLHRESNPDRFGNGSEYVAEIVYEGLADWAYGLQDAFAASYELQEQYPHLDLEIGQNGYCLLLVLVA